ARALLQAVEAGQISDKEIPVDQVRLMLLHRDAKLDPIIEKHWGKVRSATPGETQLRIRNLQTVLSQGRGDPANGHRLFTEHCGKCHQLFGEGNKVGPDLTGADRQNRDFLLTNIVDPNAVIRNEYVAYVVAMKDGRLLTGLIADSTPKTVTLLDEKNQRTTLSREAIEEINPSPVSLMPEKLLDPLSAQEVRDLFSY